eukprot:CAMPEP_0202729712 /NCGR_PEP_ID=MMETSP1385-20130828/186274_1 /ASSEMBLY_ACC=CAM_ASM_000861 /TAXON_ID=933848 /ORGANISM="Elphidium margaritaceum" /LENGTH=411 /DNA_ID=CAMNT_0049395979 /DNA_START=103 /DNA_END=1339 /DNA_ORIENTATION=-
MCNELPPEIKSVNLVNSEKPKPFVPNSEQKSALQAYMQNEFCLGPCIHKTSKAIQDVDKKCFDGIDASDRRTHLFKSLEKVEDSSCSWSKFGIKHPGYRARCKRPALDLQGLQCSELGPKYHGTHQRSQQYCYTKCTEKGTISCDDPANLPTKQIGVYKRESKIVAIAESEISEWIYGCRLGPSQFGFRRLCVREQSIAGVQFAPQKEGVGVKFAENLETEMGPNTKQGKERKERRGKREKFEKKQPQSAIKFPKYTHNTLKKMDIIAGVQFAPQKEGVGVKFAENLETEMEPNTKQKIEKRQPQSAIKFPKYTKESMGKINSRYARDPQRALNEVFNQQVTDIRRYGRRVANEEMLDFYEQEYGGIEDEEDSEYDVVKDELDDLMQEIFIAGYTRGLQQQQKRKKPRYFY